MTARNFLATLPTPRPVGNESEITAIGVRYDPDTNPPEYQPLIRGRKKTPGSEIPMGTIQFDVRFTDGSYGSALSAGSVSDGTPFDGSSPLHNQLFWYEWNKARGRFDRLTSDPVDGATTTIDAGDDIDIMSAKTPRGVRFSWTYT